MTKDEIALLVAAVTPILVGALEETTTTRKRDEARANLRDATFDRIAAALERIAGVVAPIDVEMPHEEVLKDFRLPFPSQTPRR